MATRSLRINGRRLEKLKCVAIGDSGVGKTCLLVSYTTNSFPEKYVPTIFDNHSVNLKVDRTPVRLELWDTAGTEEYNILRPLAYDNADIFMICFSINNVKSFENVKNKWIPDIRSYSKVVPFFIVGTKIDLREDLEYMQKLRDNNGEVTKAQGQRLAESTGGQYLECSALSQKNLKYLFDNIVRIALIYNRSKYDSDGGRCILL